MADSLVLHNKYLKLDELQDLSLLASAAYSDRYNGGIPGWTAITGELLNYGLNSSLVPGHESGNTNYHYKTPSGIPFNISSSASATVFYSESKKSVVVAFRGTDELIDSEDWLSIESYSESFDVLMESVEAYALSNGIENIWFTGHSLGAGAAEVAIGRYSGSSSFSFAALAMASPLASYDETDDRIVNYGHAGDLVYSINPRYSLGSNAVGNVHIVFDNGNWVLPDIDSLDLRQHDHTWAYPHSLRMLTSSGFLNGLSREAKVIVVATNEIPEISDESSGWFHDESVLILGLDSVEPNLSNPGVLLSPNDFLIGGGNSDSLEGFGGDDILRGDAVLFGNGGRDHLSGGKGNDVFLGTLGELNGDTIVDLEIGDRLFVEGARFDDDEVTFSASEITIRENNTTYSISATLPNGAEYQTSRGIALDGSSGTWISVEELSYHDAYEPRLSIREFLEGRVEDSDGRLVHLYDHEVQVEEVLPQYSNSFHGSGSSGRVEISPINGSVSVQLSTNDDDNEASRAGASASYRDQIYLFNPNVEEGEQWSITLTYDPFFESASPTPLGNYAVSASFSFKDHGFVGFSTAEIDSYPEMIRKNNPGTVFTVLDANLDWVTREDIGMAAYSYEVQLNSPYVVAEVGLGTSPIRTWQVWGQPTYYSVGASISIEDLPDGAYFRSASGYFLGTGKVSVVEHFADLSAPSVLTTEALTLSSPGSLLGGPLNTRLEGSTGADYIEDYEGHNELLGSLGDDALLSGMGNDVLVGGAGNDFINGGAGTNFLFGDEGADTLLAGTSEDYLSGGSGADVIRSLGGADLLSGGEGDDTLIIESSALFESGYFAFNASSGSQTGTGVMLDIGGMVRSSAVILGGTGLNSAKLSSRNDAFFLHDSYSDFFDDVVLEADFQGRSSAPRFAELAILDAMSGDDLVDLTSPDYSLSGNRMTIMGGGGNDTIWSADSDDVIYGGVGTDHIFSGSGHDEVYGGLGADVFEFTETSTNVVVADFDLSEGDMLRFYNSSEHNFYFGASDFEGGKFTMGFADFETGVGGWISISLPQEVDFNELVSSAIEII